VTTGGAAVLGVVTAVTVVVTGDAQPASANMTKNRRIDEIAYGTTLAISKHVRRAIFLSLLVLASPSLLARAATPGCDFNGDTFDDLAAGAPGEDVGSISTTGAVNVLYGASGGLSSSGNQFWSLDTPGIQGVAAGHEGFGATTACGDFDGDGYSDLAIGSPGEDVGSVLNAGVVHILYGSVSGLTAAGDQFFTQDSSGVPGTAESSDRLGQALVVADFNGDTFADLAVGIPDEAIGALDGAGGINVWYGSPTGLSGSGSQFFSQDTEGIDGTAEADDALGWSLAAGDFDGDGFDDIAVGAFTEDLNGVGDTGMINVVFGSAAGLTASGDQTWSQDSSGIAGNSETGDFFGYSLAAGDFDGDAFADLAIGASGEDVDTVTTAGAVTVIYGAAGGLDAAGNQGWQQDTPGIIGTAESGDRFGLSITAADIGGDGKSDLVIGVPFENIGSAVDAGAAHVIYGTAGGLDESGDQSWHQDSSGIAGTAEAGDVFGRSLQIGDFDGDGDDDVVFGIPGEAVGAATGAGAAAVLESNGSMLTDAGDTFWSQPSGDGPEIGDEFGTFAFP